MPGYSAQRNRRARPIYLFLSEEAGGVLHIPVDVPKIARKNVAQDNHSVIKGQVDHIMRAVEETTGMAPPTDARDLLRGAKPGKGTEL